MSRRAGSGLGRGGCPGARPTADRRGHHFLSQEEDKAQCSGAAAVPEAFRDPAVSSSPRIRGVSLHRERPGEHWVQPSEVHFSDGQTEAQSKAVTGSWSEPVFCPHSRAPSLLIPLQALPPPALQEFPSLTTTCWTCCSIIRCWSPAAWTPSPCSQPTWPASAPGGLAQGLPGLPRACEPSHLEAAKYEPSLRRGCP